MELQYLQTFLTVCKAGSISQAAKELYLTQTSVTNRIKELERELGVPLFERQGRKLVLTPHGGQFMTYAEQSLSIMDKAFLRTEEHAEPVGTLSLASLSNICTYILPALLSQFRKRFPDIEVKVATEHSRPIIDGVLKGHIDIGLVRGPIHHNGLHTHPFYRDKLIPVVAAEHPWFARASVPIQELSGQKIIAYNRFSSIWAKLERSLQEQQVQMNIVMDLDHSETGKVMVLQGQGIAFLPCSTVSIELEQGELSTFELDPPLSLFSNIDVIYNRRHPLPPHVKQLVQFLCKHSPLEGGPNS